MTLPRSALLAALAALALERARDDAPAFVPTARAELSTAFTEETALELDDAEIRVDGELLALDVPEIDVAIRRAATLADQILAVDEERVTKLERAFDALSAETRIRMVEDAEAEQTLRSRSALEGAAVLFEWDATEGRFRRRFERGGAGDSDLDALEPEADLKGFLPPTAVEAGATWSVPAAALGRALALGGDLRLLPELEGELALDLDPHVALAAALAHLGAAGDAWEGEVEARYAGATDADGTALGRIALAVDAEARADLTERLREASALERVEIDRLVATFTLEAEGELLWNLDAGRAHALRLEGAVSIDATCAWKERADAEPVEIEGRYRLAGTTRYAVTVED